MHTKPMQRFQRSSVHTLTIFVFVDLEGYVRDIVENFNILS